MLALFFSIVKIELCFVKDENKQKGAGFSPYFKKKILDYLVHIT